MSGHFEEKCRACGRASVHRFCYLKSGFPVYRCASCGVGRTIIPDDFRSAEIYSEEYFEGGQTDGYAGYSHSEAILRFEFRKILKQLARTFPLSGRLLEVGSAYGYFLFEAQRHFDVVGVEVSEAAVNHAKQRGLNVICGELTDSILEPYAPVDVAVMLDVIEHLESPADVLSTIHANMKPGGCLLITTGDWGSLYSRVAGPRWRLMTPPQHLFFFTPQSMRQLLARVGYDVIQLRRPAKFVPLSLILFQLGRIARGKPFRAESLSSLGVPVNLFDAMQVIARRRE